MTVSLSQQRRAKKRADLKNSGGFECHRFVVIKVFQERLGIKLLHSHFQIGNVMCGLDIRDPFGVKREKQTPSKVRFSCLMF